MKNKKKKKLKLNRFELVVKFGNMPKGLHAVTLVKECDKEFEFIYFKK